MSVQSSAATIAYRHHTVARLQRRHSRDSLIGSVRENHSQGTTIVAFLMILFGFAGVVTSFTRHFFGVATSEEHPSTVARGAIGLFYVVSGLLILTKRKSAV